MRPSHLLIIAFCTQQHLRFLCSRTLNEITVVRDTAVSKMPGGRSFDRRRNWYGRYGRRVLCSRNCCKIFTSLKLPGFGRNEKWCVGDSPVMRRLIIRPRAIVRVSVAERKLRDE